MMPPGRQAKQLRARRTTRARDRGRARRAAPRERRTAPWAPCSGRVSRRTATRRRAAAHSRHNSTRCAAGANANRLQPAAAPWQLGFSRRGGCHWKEHEDLPKGWSKDGTLERGMYSGWRREDARSHPGSRISAAVKWQCRRRVWGSSDRPMSYAGVARWCLTRTAQADGLAH